MKILFLHTSDTHFLITNKKQVRNLDDIKGMKIRVIGKYPTEMWKTLGASPLLLAAPDTYDAAQKGVIDGMAVNWGLIATFRFNEVCKYWTDAGVYTNIFAMAMNKEKWNSLSPDIQQAIMSVSGVGGAEFGGEQSSGAGVKDDVAAAMNKTGKIMQKVDLEVGEYDKWKSIAGKPLWGKWIEEMKSKGLNGQKAYDELLKLIEKYKD